MAAIRKGLVEFTYQKWGGDAETCCHLVSIHDVGWDLVYFSHSANPYWSQIGTYEKRSDFTGHYAVYFKTRNPNEKPSEKRDFRILVEGLGFFKDLDHYYSFIREILQGKVQEELWEDTK